MDKLRSMEVFVAVADAGSFTAAAHALGLSSVMVGKHVRQLEQQLGARLIERSTRRQRLTDTGRVFCDDCRRVLEQVRWAESAVERQRSTPSGLLRISAPTTLGANVVAPVVARFLALHPQVRVELVLSDTVVDLLEEGFDLAVRIGPVDTDRLVVRPLRPYRMLVCAAPAYLAAHGAPRTPADLAQHRCLNHLVWNRQTFWRFADPAPGAWPAQGAFASNNGQALRQAALAGAGLLLQPEELVADDIAAGRLVSVLDGHLPTPRPVNVVYPAVRHPLPRLTHFVAHLLAELGPQVPPPSPPMKKARTKAGRRGA